MAGRGQHSPSDEGQIPSIAGRCFGFSRSNEMTLRDQGFRFVKRGDEFKWVHPADLQPGDTDCSDMTDAEFDALVLGT